MKKIKTKIWIEENENLIFGSGKLQILEAIKETGSINKAAKQLKISYRKAWSNLKVIEERCGDKIIISQKGGVDGGNTILTNFAEDLIVKFKIIERKIKDYSNKIFNEVFLNQDN